MAFCLCPKTVCEAKWKNIGSVMSAESISRQPSADYVEWLLLTLVQIYNEKVQAGQREIQNVQSVEKRNSKSVIRAESSAHGI